MVFTPASPSMINARKPMVSGPVSSRAATADTYRITHCEPTDRTGNSIHATGPTAISTARARFAEHEHEHQQQHRDQKQAMG